MRKKIIELEEKLRVAMCESDITLLEQLLAPDLLFTNHLGKLISKQEDIEAHRKRVFSIEKIILSKQQIMIFDNSAVVSTQADITGTYQQKKTSNSFRFTRIWRNNKDNWQVVAGHSSIINP